MPEVIYNPHRHVGLPGLGPYPKSDPRIVARLLEECPAHAVTPLLEIPALAAQTGIARLSIKDERARMGLGSFKALGAAFTIALDASQVKNGDDWTQALRGRCYVTASAGNHGLSVASGARLFGAKSVVYLAQSVPDAFAARLRKKGAKVERAGSTYEESMSAAEKAAREYGWTLLSDSSWPGYIELPLRVMEGYLQLAAEVAHQIAAPPTHILVQAGVGGLAAAIAAYARQRWGDDPTMIVVEPAAAPALAESIRAGRLLTVEGPVSAMGRLDCKTPSMIALAGLARDADVFVTITETEADEAVSVLSDHGIRTTPSGAAGIAPLLANLPEFGERSHVLAFLTEGPLDG